MNTKNIYSNVYDDDVGNNGNRTEHLQQNNF